jgi:tetratricopeptide (TPR) repeat protein
MNPVRRCLLLAAVVLLALPFGANARTEPGTPFPAVELRTLAGKKEKVLSSQVKANVVIFFRTGHDRSTDALRQMSACQKDLAGRPIRWVAIVSSSEPLAEVQAEIQRTALAMPVLVDEGDALYQALGIRFHPEVVIVDGASRVVATEMYRQVDYCDVVKTRIRVLLGEADQAAMERAVNPEASDLPGQEHPMKKAMRDVNMARRLVALESYDLAIAQAKKALVIAPVAEAYSVIGDAWRKQGNCAEATKAYGSALKMNPREPAALEGLKACGGSRG